MRNFTYFKKIILENKNKIIKVLGLGIIILSVILYISSYNFANSGAGHNMSGYAWSSYDNGGVGWISFNSNNHGGSVDYGVTVDTNKNLVGYAWSGNSVDSSVNGYGWLKFGGLSGIQIRPGIISEDAKFAGNSNNLTGWARFCAVYQSGCSGNYYHGSGPVNNDLSTNPYLGGWDGWVSLSGTSPDYGVKLSGDTFSGYAWGGDVVGWISFNCLNGGNCATSNYKVTYNVVAGPVVTLSVDKPVLTLGNSFTLSWNGSNLIDNSTGCLASGAWSGQKNSPSSPVGGVTMNPSAVGSYKYGIKCLGLDGTTWSSVSEVTVNVTTNSESVTLKYTPVAGGPPPKEYTTTLTWTTIDTKVNTCKASGGWTGDKLNKSSGSTSETGVIVKPGPLVTYTIICEGKSGSLVSYSIKLNEKSGRQGPKWEWE